MIEGGSIANLPLKPRIGLAGSGNLAWHWDRLFRASGFDIEMHYHRSPLDETLWNLSSATRHTEMAKDLIELDWVFVALSDRAISDFSKALKDFQGLLIHGSGGLSLDVLGPGRAAVFYLPQTFTAGRVLDYTALTACIEARRAEDAAPLSTFANQLGLQALELDSSARLKLHLAAVFANNFANLQFALAERVMNREGLDARLLVPLIEETARKAIELGADAAQTGPARRGDLATVRRHLGLLKTIELRRIYRTLSEFLFEDSRKHRSGSKPARKT